MPYLLDGNNLIGSQSGRSGADEGDRTALVAEIAQRLRGHRARVALYFDGPATRPASSLGSLTVCLGTGASADDAIVRDVKNARDPSSMIVVTADRGLLRRVREAGGKACSPEDFFSRFGRGLKRHLREPAPDSIDVEEWTRFFGDERNRRRD